MCIIKAGEILILYVILHQLIKQRINKCLFILNVSLFFTFAAPFDLSFSLSPFAMSKTLIIII